MVKKSLPIVWDKSAYLSLQSIFDYIRRDSQLNAEKVRRGVLNTILNLSKYSENYPPDRFKKDNNGNYRAFEKFSVRVAYKITEREIKILRIRHVKQEPKRY